MRVSKVCWRFPFAGCKCCRCYITTAIYSELYVYVTGHTNSLHHSELYRNVCHQTWIQLSWYKLHLASQWCQKKFICADCNITDKDCVWPSTSHIKTSINTNWQSSAFNSAFASTERLALSPSARSDNNRIKADSLSQTALHAAYLMMGMYVAVDWLVYCYTFLPISHVQMIQIQRHTNVPRAQKTLPQHGLILHYQPKAYLNNEHDGVRIMQVVPPFASVMLQHQRSFHWCYITALPY